MISLVKNNMMKLLPQPVVPKIVGDVAAWLTVAAMIAAVIAVLCYL